MNASRCLSLVEVRPGKIRACWGWSVVTALVLAIPAGASSPNPVALLRGVEQARLSVRTGDLEIAVVIEQRLPLSQKDDLALHITFDGEKLTCRKRQRVLFIDDSDGQGPTRGKQLKAMNNDREAFVRAGLGRWEEKLIRSAWDGTHFCQHIDSGGASYLDHTKGNAEMVFNPRLLGLGRYQPGDSVADALRADDEKNITLVGAEVINEIPTWHVMVKPNPEVVNRYWIEDREGFRVHRFRIESLNGLPVSVDSFYDEKSTGPIPSRVIHREHMKDGKLKRETRFEVTKAEFNKPITSNVGTLGSLDPALGDAVSDERIGRRLGYWDGEGLTEDRAEAIKLGKSRLHAIGGIGIYLTIGGVVLGLLVVLSFIYRGRRRPQPTNRASAI